MRNVAVMGSTGSIGTQTLDVIRRFADRFDVAALAAHSCSALLIEQVKEFRPDVVVVATPEAASELEGAIDKASTVLVGDDGLRTASSLGEVTLNAVLGFAGLPVTLATLEAGKRLALANKESLIAAAPLVNRVRSAAGGEIVPVDSEHCAIHQCLAGLEGIRGLSRIVLTASGGPFRELDASALSAITIDDALAHPTWSMGPKITVDSSTLMNKGLEVIEAHALFGVDYDLIDVVIHPQSIVHSMVELVDGSTLAQLSNPDMRLPIAYALGYPERLDAGYGALDFSNPMALTFEPPRLEVFRCLDLAYEAGRLGGAAPAWLSAANEVAVEAFLAGAIPWTAIAEVVEATLVAYEPDELATLEAVAHADQRARDVTAATLATKMDA